MVEELIIGSGNLFMGPNENIYITMYLNVLSSKNQLVKQLSILF